MSPEPGDALATLRAYRARPEHRLVGLMTGTSADAIDAALVRMRGDGLATECELVAYRETPLVQSMRREILEVTHADEITPERLMSLDAALGESYAAATLDLLAGARLAPDAVDAIGMHGQTVRHRPRAAGTMALSLQLGSAAVLAERTGIAVVSNFRARDTAAGGEGAPLVPLFDWRLSRSADEARVLLNLGGMANVTYVPRGGNPNDVIAFDTGPGNSVLDDLVGLVTEGKERFDRDGQRALRGRASEMLVGELLGDPFFAQPPPRSTGRERFGRAYAERGRVRAKGLGLGDDDLIATAVELTARSVAGAVQRFLSPLGPVDAVYVSGGGVRNPALMAALERRLAPVPLRRAEVLGVPADAKEAMAFAFLAHLTLSGLPGNLPGATGAAHAVVLGQITPGAAR
ncbi:MAG TPA: anhydro-N-acetylmuramic acid kinase [Candidatus Limnocylindria bacterium]|nr:anhydro-N-acetylmuramic acid kinase [Candidatus Limnocylindria bacterium]